MRKGRINQIKEPNYLGVTITNDGNHDAEIKNRINKWGSAISKLNNVLWDRNMTPKIKNQNLPCF